MLTTIFIKLCQLVWYLIRVPYYLFILAFIPKDRRSGNEIDGLLSIRDIFIG